MKDKITIEDLRAMSEEEKKDLAHRMISPKRCGGLGREKCARCGDIKHTFERPHNVTNWVCEDCRIVDGTYTRHCDDCKQDKKATYTPMQMWHWWCEDCETPWLRKFMDGQLIKEEE